MKVDVTADPIGSNEPDNAEGGDVGRSGDHDNLVKILAVVEYRRGGNFGGMRPILVDKSLNEIAILNSKGERVSWVLDDVSEIYLDSIAMAQNEIWTKFRNYLSSRMGLPSPYINVVSFGGFGTSKTLFFWGDTHWDHRGIIPRFVETMFTEYAASFIEVNMCILMDEEIYDVIDGGTRRSFQGEVGYSDIFQASFFSLKSMVMTSLESANIILTLLVKCQALLVASVSRPIASLHVITTFSVVSLKNDFFRQVRFVETGDWDLDSGMRAQTGDRLTMLSKNSLSMRTLRSVLDVLKREFKKRKNKVKKAAMNTRMSMKIDARSSFLAAENGKPNVLEKESEIGNETGKENGKEKEKEEEEVDPEVIELRKLISDQCKRALLPFLFQDSFFRSPDCFLLTCLRDSLSSYEENKYYLDFVNELDVLSGVTASKQLGLSGGWYSPPPPPASLMDKISSFSLLENLQLALSNEVQKSLEALQICLKGEKEETINACEELFLIGSTNDGKESGIGEERGKEEDDDDEEINYDSNQIRREVDKLEIQAEKLRKASLLSASIGMGIVAANISNIASGASTNPSAIPMAIPTAAAAAATASSTTASSSSSSSSIPLPLSYHAPVLRSLYYRRRSLFLFRQLFFILLARQKDRRGLEEVFNHITVVSATTANQLTESLALVGKAGGGGAFRCAGDVKLIEESVSSHAINSTTILANLNHGSSSQHHPVPPKEEDKATKNAESTNPSSSPVMVQRKTLNSTPSQSNNSQNLVKMNRRESKLAANSSSMLTSANPNSSSMSNNNSYNNSNNALVSNQNRNSFVNGNKNSHSNINKSGNLHPTLSSQGQFPNRNSSAGGTPASSTSPMSRSRRTGLTSAGLTYRRQSRLDFLSQWILHRASLHPVVTNRAGGMNSALIGLASPSNVNNSSINMSNPSNNSNNNTNNNNNNNNNSLNTAASTTNKKKFGFFSSLESVSSLQLVDRWSPWNDYLGGGSIIKPYFKVLSSSNPQGEFTHIWLPRGYTVFGRSPRARVLATSSVATSGAPSSCLLVPSSVVAMSLDRATEFSSIELFSNPIMAQVLMGWMTDLQTKLLNYQKAQHEQEKRLEKELEARKILGRADRAPNVASTTPTPTMDGIDGYVKGAEVWVDEESRVAGSIWAFSSLGPPEKSSSGESVPTASTSATSATTSATATAAATATAGSSSSGSPWTTFEKFPRSAVFDYWESQGELPDVSHRYERFQQESRSQDGYFEVWIEGDEDIEDIHALVYQKFNTTKIVPAPVFSSTSLMTSHINQSHAASASASASASSSASAAAASTTSSTALQRSMLWAPVYVNGELIRSERDLQDQDVIRLGTSHYLLYCVPSSSPVPGGDHHDPTSKHSSSSTSHSAGAAASSSSSSSSSTRGNSSLPSPSPGSTSPFPPFFGLGKMHPILSESSMRQDSSHSLTSSRSSFQEPQPLGTLRSHALTTSNTAFFSLREAMQQLQARELEMVRSRNTSWEVALYRHYFRQLREAFQVAEREYRFYLHEKVNRPLAAVLPRQEKSPLMQMDSYDPSPVVVESLMQSMDVDRLVQWCGWMAAMDRWNGWALDMRRGCQATFRLMMGTEECDLTTATNTTTTAPASSSSITSNRVVWIDAWEALDSFLSELDGEVDFAHEEERDVYYGGGVVEATPTTATSSTASPTAHTTPSRWKKERQEIRLGPSERWYLPIVEGHRIDFPITSSSSSGGVEDHGGGGEGSGEGSWKWSLSTFGQRCHLGWEQWSLFLSPLCRRDLGVLESLYSSTSSSSSTSNNMNKNGEESIAALQDPFVESCEEELIGVAYCYLDSLQYLLDVQDTLPLVNRKGMVQGNLKLRARAWIDQVEVAPSYLSADQDTHVRQFLQRKFLLRLTFESLGGLPRSLSGSPSVRFHFFHHAQPYQTPRYPGSSSHPTLQTQVQLQQKITPDFLHYLTTGCLELEVYGRRVTPTSSLSSSSSSTTTTSTTTSFFSPTSMALDYRQLSLLPLEYRLCRQEFVRQVLLRLEKDSRGHPVYENASVRRREKEIRYCPFVEVKLENPEWTSFEVVKKSSAVDDGRLMMEDDGGGMNVQESVGSTRMGKGVSEEEWEAMQESLTHLEEELETSQKMVQKNTKLLDMKVAEMKELQEKFDCHVVNAEFEDAQKHLKIEQLETELKTLKKTMKEEQLHQEAYLNRVKKFVIKKTSKFGKVLETYEGCDNQSFVAELEVAHAQAEKKKGCSIA